MAGDCVDRGLALPALAAHFGRDRGAMLRNGSGDFIGEVKITSNTPGIGAVHTKNGFCVVEIGGVLDLAVLGDTFGIEIAKVDNQGFQLRKPVGERR